MKNKLSIIIPAYNEEDYIGKLLETILSLDLNSVGFEKEVIVVDDNSKDRTGEIVKKFSNVKYFRQEKNQGKGRAVQRGLAESTGDWFLVQDADLEYDPKDYFPMLKLATTQQVSIYGSRTLGQKVEAKDFWQKLGKHPEQKFAPWFAGKLLSFWTFLIYGVWITDTLTAYKLYPSKLVKSFSVKTNGFETDHELTAKLIKSGIKIIEVPISYIPRTVEQGKKIKARDFFCALWTLFRFRFNN